MFEAQKSFQHRYGIRYLISKNPTDFIELIQPERDILKQALGLT